MAPLRIRHGPLRVAFRLVAGLFVLGFFGVVASTIVSSIHDRTETLQATLRIERNIPYSHGSFVEFYFANGGYDHVREDDSQSLFDAVDKFGPGPARVTRTTNGSSIHSVEFHGKTYDINSGSDDLLTGIIAILLGFLALGWVILGF